MPLLFPNSTNTANANVASTSSPSALSSFALVPPLPSGMAYHNGSDSDESGSEHLETDYEDLESYQTRLAAKIETKVLLLTNSGALSISTIRDAPKYRGSWSSRGEMVLDYGEDISPRVITNSRVDAEPEKASVREKSRDSKGRSLSKSKSKSKSRSKSRSKSTPGKQKRQKTATKAENALEKCGQVSQVLQMDISMVMRARAEKGYGLTDPLFNVSILRDFGHWAEESSTLKTPVVKKEYVKLGLGLDDLLADTWEWVASE